MSKKNDKYLKINGHVVRLPIKGMCVGFLIAEHGEKYTKIPDLNFFSSIWPLMDTSS